MILVIVIIFIMFIIITVTTQRRPYFQNIFENRNSCLITYKKTNKIHSILLNLDKQNYENDDIRLVYDSFDRSFQIKNISFRRQKCW